RQPGPGEDAVGGERRAAVRLPVADVDDASIGQPAALAPIAADVAGRVAVPANAPAFGAGIEPVRDQFEVDLFAGEQRTDQLLEAAREKERVVALDQLVEAGPDAGGADEPRGHLAELRALHGRELDLHQLAVADLAAHELLPGALEDVVVAELLENEPERVDLRTRPVPVEDEPRLGIQRHALATVRSPTCADF